MKKIIQSLKKIHPLIYIAVAVLAALAVFNAVRMSVQQKKARDAEGVLSVYYIDVGQGDGMLIRCGDTVILVDGGEEENAKRTVKYIKSLGVKAVDCYVATHPHSDHIGAAPEIFSAFQVREVMTTAFSALNVPTTKTYENFITAATEEKCKITYVQPGKTYEYGDLALTALAPVTESADYNDMSIMFKLVYGSTSFLFTGDAQAASEEAVLAAGYDVSADVLKVGHHGSSGATSQAFLSAVHPAYAVISCGKNNDYGHPHVPTLSRLEKEGATVLRTDESGTVVLCSDGKNVYVKG